GGAMEHQRQPPAALAAPRPGGQDRQRLSRCDPVAAGPRGSHLIPFHGQRLAAIPHRAADGGAAWREPGELMHERGAILGIVMILLTLVLTASGFAFWGLRGEMQSTGNDRLSHQLFDCAEEALAIGKQVFGSAQRPNWDAFLFADVCS